MIEEQHADRVDLLQPLQPVRAGDDVLRRPVLLSQVRITTLSCVGAAQLRGQIGIGLHQAQHVRVQRDVGVGVGPEMCHAQIGEKGGKQFQPAIAQRLSEREPRPPGQFGLQQQRPGGIEEISLCRAEGGRKLRQLAHRPHPLQRGCDATRIYNGTHEQLAGAVDRLRPDRGIAAGMTQPDQKAEMAGHAIAGAAEARQVDGETFLEQRRQWRVEIGAFRELPQRAGGLRRRWPGTE